MKPILTEEELREKISEILNNHVDFAEWATDDSETTDELMSLLSQQKSQWREEVKNACKMELKEWEGDNKVFAEAALHDMLELLGMELGESKERE